MMTKTQTLAWFFMLTGLSWASFWMNALTGEFHPLIQIYTLFGGILGILIVVILLREIYLDRRISG